MNPKKKLLRYECIGMVGLSLMCGGEGIELHDHCFGNAVDLVFHGSCVCILASNHNEWVQIRDDREQEEFLREWNKKWEVR